MLQFHFLGAPRLENHNRPLALDTRKAIALAAYLALTHTAHERDELAAFFYPDAETSRARAALRRTLSTLKTALGENVLDIERETIGLNLKGIRVDVLEFRALAKKNSIEALTRAAQLYQGDFFAGFTLRDSPAFDEWQFFETESLRKQFAAVLEQLVARQAEQRSYNRAIEYARRWLALDPLHEPAHRALMLLYARDGQRAAALRQYHECVRQLDTELGVTPLPETTELYRAIQENRIQPTDHKPQTPKERQRTTIESVENPKLAVSQGEPPKLDNNFPLVGRTRELELLLHAYKNIRREGCLLIIEGEAGIGKTRLAEEFLQRVTHAGAMVLTTRGYAEQRALAYAPFAQTLRAAFEDPRFAKRLEGIAAPLRAQAARLVPELASPASPAFDYERRSGQRASIPAQDGIGAQARFFDAVTLVILALTHNGSPGVFFCDDAQWLDEASFDLLAFLIRRLKNSPLCILLTWRGEEMAHNHPLRRLYADELRQERAHLVSLTRLAPADAQALVKIATERGAPIDAALGAQLYRESEGQPFFLVESLKWIEREKQFPKDGLPATVRELLHSRLAPLSETAQQLLSAAAVLGHSFDFEILDAVSGRSEQETLAGVEELGAYGILTETVRAGGVPQYDFTHEKIRALVYQETLLARRRLLHRRAADALLQRARLNHEALAGQIAAQVAPHLSASGDETRAAEFYKRAGDYARSVFANREAVDNYSAALALSPGVGFSDAAQLHKNIGDAQTLLGEYHAALKSYEASAAFGAPDAEQDIARVYLRRGEWEHAARHLQNALQTTQETAVHALLYADLALAEHQLQHNADAQQHAQRALRLAQRARDARAIAQAHNILGILARTRGEWSAARKHLEASCARAEKMNDVGAYAAALNNLALVEQATNNDARALELAQQALELVTRAGDRHRQAALHNHLADLYHALGRAEDSIEQLKRAVAIYAEIGGGEGEWQPEIWKLEEW